MPRGRCARAERTVGPCWETSDAGIKTLDHSCPSCTRMMQQDVLMSDTALSANDAPGESHDLTAKRGLPVDVNKFNNLVRLHKQTCDRRYIDLPLCISNCTAANIITAQASSATAPRALPSTQTPADPLQPATFRPPRPHQACPFCLRPKQDFPSSPSLTNLRPSSASLLGTTTSGMPMPTRPLLLNSTTLEDRMPLG